MGRKKEISFGHKYGGKDGRENGNPKSSTLLKEANLNNREIKDVRSKDELTHGNKMLVHLPNKQSIQYEGGEIRKIRKQYSQKFLTPIQKNEQLFDAIHNYLDNPKRPEVEMNS